MHPRVSSQVREELVGQELFLYDADTGVAHCLNSGAALIWFLCDGSRSKQEIASAISDAFDLSQQQVLEHVQSTLAQFRAKGLIEQ